MRRRSLRRREETDAAIDRRVGAGVVLGVVMTGMAANVTLDGGGGPLWHAHAVRAARMSPERCAASGSGQAVGVVLGAAERPLELARRRLRQAAGLHEDDLERRDPHRVA